MELCITKIYALEMVRFYFFFNGLPRVDKLVKGLKLRYQFPNLNHVYGEQGQKGLCHLSSLWTPKLGNEGRYDIT